jgi:hypothetical protein
LWWGRQFFYAALGFDGEQRLLGDRRKRRHVEHDDQRRIGRIGDRRIWRQGDRIRW